MTRAEDVIRLHAETSRPAEPSADVNPHFNLAALRRGVSATLAFTGGSDSEVGKACREVLRWLDAEGVL